MKLPWKAIGKVVGAAAPLLGSILGGPLGGAAGTILASVLGVDANPGAVMDALNKQQDRDVLLRKIERQYHAELVKLKTEADIAMVREVNTTYRAELTNGTWYQKAWRPTWGYVSCAAWAGFVVAIIWTVLMGSVEEIAVVTSLIGAMTVVFAVPGAIVGVTAWGRSNEKVAVATGRKPKGMLESLADRIRGDNEDDEPPRTGNWNRAPVRGS